MCDMRHSLLQLWTWISSIYKRKPVILTRLYDTWSTASTRQTQNCQLCSQARNKLWEEFSYQNSWICWWTWESLILEGINEWVRQMATYYKPLQRIWTLGHSYSLERAIVISTHVLIGLIAHTLVSSDLVNGLDNDLEAQTDTKLKWDLPTLL